MGTILPGRFEPIRLLRKDRGCATFVATDRGLGRNEVVVKLIGKGYFTSDTDALVDVFSWYRGLRHVFISEVLDAGVTAKRELFYVRPYHPPSEFFTTSDTDSLKALVSAVDFLHSMGRAHGSIKPSNVFAGRGRMRITDPSVCRNRTDPRRSLTEEDIRFSAPEVLSGGEISVDSDLYSLGALLYRFFSGRDPFEDSDLESLKAKYIWASPRSLGSVSHVSKVMGDIVTTLLDKDPRVRFAAFESLKEELDTAATPAVRAPVVGRREDVEKALTQLTEKSRLSMVLVEGSEGTGKSRFVEELQNRASLGGHLLVACETKAQDPLMDLARKAVSVVDEQGLGAGAASLSRLRRLASEEPEPASKSEQGEIERDLLSLLASISRQTRLLLVIEDVDRTGRRLKGLIEALVQQLSDLELSILVTARSGGTPIKTISSSRDFLGEDFHLLTLGLLNPADSAILSSFFSSDRDRRSHAEQKAAGNPFFLEEYCKNSGQTGIPKRVRKTISSLLPKLPKEIRRVAEVLSIFEQPVSWNVLPVVSGIPEDDLRDVVAYLERWGLVQMNSLSIRYPDARTLLQMKIPKARRAELHHRYFQYLKEIGGEERVIADHAFQGGMFESAGNLYRQLARAQFTLKDYGAAARYYSQVVECRVKNPAVLPLAPSDSVRLAKCLALQGNIERALIILRELLESQVVCEDPEALSSVYAAFAAPVMGAPIQERVRLLKQAIDCLGEDSPQLVHRYRALAVAFLSTGDLVAAERAIEKFQSRCASDENLHLFEDIRASVLMSQGNFKDAVRYLKDCQHPWSTVGVAANNLAVCVEQLGDLKKAREIQQAALQEGEASGTLWVQLMSLGNLGSMETKLGNFVAAEKYFAVALKKIGELERQGRKSGIQFGITYADAAGHFIQRGEYRKAIEYLSRVRFDREGSLPLELLLVAVTQCELHLALGQTQKVQKILDDTKRLNLSGSFSEVERLLVEVRLLEPSAELCRQLEESSAACGRLGTLYQECRVRLALSDVLLSVGELEKGRAIANSARRIAQKNGYRILGVRAFLLMGLSAERETEKEFALTRSLDEAAEIGLPPMMVECALAIGSWRFGRGDYPEARDFLSKGVSIATRLAEGLGRTDQRNYLSQTKIRRARALLKEASVRASSLPSKGARELLDKETAYLPRLYRLTSAMTAAVDQDSTMSRLLETLKEAIRHPVVVVLGIGQKMVLNPVQTVLSEEMRKRVESVAAAGGDKPYITGAGTSIRRYTAVWVPIVSLTLPGGIYVESRPEQTALDEREIDFLTIVAVIAGAAFDRVCSKAGTVSVSSSVQFHGIIGNSKPMRDVRARIEIAATNAATVLIEGESGTGKELVAKAIHERSARAKAPFVPVDCGALPEGLIEAELFGAKKGAYTGALTDRQGLFEAAHNGTIFLDEISNLGMPAQAKLLRVLQEREVRRVGSTTGKVVDVRLIAATNCNLEKLVRQGQFRQDLLYRLKVLHVLLPPLRDRKDDIPLLATAFLGRLNALSQTNKYFGPRVMESFLEHDYPGNVRELQNAVERGFYSTSSAVVTQIDFLRETNSIDSPGQNETASWFKELTEGRENFWSGVHDRYKRRDISRERVVALVDYGLRTTRGSYKTMASMLQIPKEEYHRFMDFLRRNRCLLDFRPYRIAD